MNVEIISVGTELLLGDILNTNAQYVSKELAILGINVYRQSTVGDNEDRLIECFDDAFKNSDIVITTGGLGPTGDDITKECAAKYFGQEMVLHEESWGKIKDIFAKLGKKGNIAPNNKKQAYFPIESQILINNNGTAPGAIFEKDNKKIIVLPGPPYEMKPMFQESVKPYLMKFTDSVFESKYIRFFGIGESYLEIKLLELLDKQTNPTIALYAKQGEVLVRVTAKANTKEECFDIIDEEIEEIKNIAGEYIYTIGGEDIASSQTELNNVVAKLLIQKNKKIAIAESCTGGLISASLVEYPGISEVLLEGCVTYSNEAKMSRLGVSKSTLEKFGAVSVETAMEMAKGVAENLNADIGISTTGIAGPDGGSDEKPVGLVYIGIYAKGQTMAKKCNFAGSRNKIRTRATNEAINQVRLILESSIF